MNESLERFIKDFEDLDPHKKKVIMTYITALNESIDFSPISFPAVKFYEMLEMFFSKLWQTKKPSDQMSAELYCILEIFYKSGIIVGKLRSDKIKVKDEALKRIEKIKNIFNMVDKTTRNRQN